MSYCLLLLAFCRGNSHYGIVWGVSYPLTLLHYAAENKTNKILALNVYIETIFTYLLILFFVAISIILLINLYPRIKKCYIYSNFQKNTNVRILRSKNKVEYCHSSTNEHVTECYYFIFFILTNKNWVTLGKM